MQRTRQGGLDFTDPVSHEAELLAQQMQQQIMDAIQEATRRENAEQPYMPTVDPLADYE
jgi:hypothetical protein